MVNYIDKIQINNNEPMSIAGDTFPGQWVPKYLPLWSSVTFNGNSVYSTPLNEYLPDDEYDYEVMIYFIACTGSVNGNCAYVWLYSGDNSSRIYGVRMCTSITRGAYSETESDVAILPIRASNRNVSIVTESGQTMATGNCWGSVCGYRRIGKNNWGNTNKVNTLQFNNNNLVFGGPLLNGTWKSVKKDIWLNVTIAGNSSQIVEADVSTYIPNDGYDYECLIDGTCTTSATANQTFKVSFRTSALNDITIRLDELVTRTASTRLSYFNSIIPVKSSDKIIKLLNEGNGVAKTNLRFEAYRRIGTNV